MKKYVLNENRKTFIFRQLEIIIAYVVVWAAVSLIYQVSDGGVSGISPFQIKINLYWFVIAAWLITCGLYCLKFFINHLLEYEMDEDGLSYRHFLKKEQTQIRWKEIKQYGKISKMSFYAFNMVETDLYMYVSTEDVTPDEILKLPKEVICIPSVDSVYEEMKSHLFETGEEKSFVSAYEKWKGKQNIYKTYDNDITIAYYCMSRDSAPFMLGVLIAIMFLIGQVYAGRFFLKIYLICFLSLYLIFKDTEYSYVVVSDMGIQKISAFRKILKEMRWEEIKNAGTIEEEMQSVFFTDQRITKQEVNHCLIFKKKMPDVIVIRKGMEDKKLMELVEKYKDETLVHKG